MSVRPSTRVAPEANGAPRGVWTPRSSLSGRAQTGQQTQPGSRTNSVHGEVTSGHACYPDIGTANARVRLPGRNGSRATVFIGDRCPLEGQSSLDLGMVCLMGKHPDSCDCVLAARVMLPCFPNIIGLCTFAFCENPIFFFKMVWIAPGRNWPCFDNIQCYWRP